jgi:hypothetical protein
MDNYPKHLAPEFDEGGAVKTSFEEWWARVKTYFPHVPENVARHWLHEHWSHSPYEYLPSRDYKFELVQWPSVKLPEIRSTWCNFEEDNNECQEHGRYLIEDVLKEYRYKTALYMLEHGDFPAPIIVLDNRDGHLLQRDLPPAYILIEGHRRFNMSLYLHSIGRLRPSVDVWLMKRDQTLRST